MEPCYITYHYLSHPPILPTPLVSRPRQAVLQQWKRSLQVGDVVDAQDKKTNWYEAVVIAVHPNNNNNNNNNKNVDIKYSPAGSGGSGMALPGLKVHFKGWSSQFDEEITPLDVERRIQVRPWVVTQLLSLFIRIFNLALAFVAPGRGTTHPGSPCP